MEGDEADMEGDGIANDGDNDENWPCGWLNVSVLSPFIPCSENDSLLIVVITHPNKQLSKVHRTTTCSN